MRLRMLILPGEVARRWLMGLALVMGLAGATPVPAQLSGQDRADVDKVSTYLNGLTTVRGDFSHFLPGNRVATGKFFIWRPGRLRFEYDAPVPLVIISDGTLVHMEDRDKRTVNGYPLRATPLYPLLKRNVNLLEDANIVEVMRPPGRLTVTARDDEGLVQGELTLILRYPDLDLLSWIQVDKDGSESVIVLQNVEKGARLNPALFLPSGYDEEDER